MAVACSSEPNLPHELGNCVPRGDAACIVKSGGNGAGTGPGGSGGSSSSGSSNGDDAGD
jgi:hypothetical protein